MLYATISLTYSRSSEMCYLNGLRNLRTIHFSLPKHIHIFFTRDSLKPFDEAVGGSNSGMFGHQFNTENTVAWTRLMASSNPHLDKVTFLVRDGFGDGIAGKWWIMNVKRKNGIKVKGKERRTNAKGDWLN